jgi:solute carrier family 25 phosphate transporter 3
MFPSDNVMANAFSPSGAAETKRNPFPAWSVVEDTKKRADAIGKEAAREFNVVSQKAQAKTGKIEPWSAKYYAACTVGGLMACVRTNRSLSLFEY